MKNLKKYWWIWLMLLIVFAVILLSPSREFGLTENQRKEIYLEFAQAESIAKIEAEEAHPEATELDAHLVLLESLSNTYLTEVQNKHSLSDEAYLSIYLEGQQKDW